MTNNAYGPLDGGRKMVLALLGGGLLLMLAASFVYRAQHPTITEQGQTRGTAPAATQQAQQAQQQEGMNALAELMARLQENPNDVAVLMALSNEFMQRSEWARAENFLKKISVVEPGNTDALYMLGISQFNLERPGEAANTFETLLSFTDDPAARFSLGVLYKHYLEAPDKAATHFTAILNNPEANAELKQRASKELETAHGN